MMNPCICCSQAETIEKPALIVDQIKALNKLIRKDPDNEVDATTNRPASSLP
jgi:hypothetical protein